MQFKNPEILYALFLLIIPIIVHLFQLRRFEKTPFTNVQFLKRLILQSRKSSQLKKWLTLFTRLLIFTCVILAFAEPYFAHQNEFSSKEELVIYLDNSFSMQTKGSNGTLLNTAVQDILQQVDKNQNITLFTNNTSYPNVTLSAIQNDVIGLDYASEQLDYESLFLKAKQFFSKDPSTIKSFIAISDFQKQSGFKFPQDSLINYQIVQLKPQSTANVSIDSVHISKKSLETVELTIQLKNYGTPLESLPIALYDKDKLIAKSAISIKDEEKTVFTIPNNKAIEGRISIEDEHLHFDNNFYFNIDDIPLIKVLTVSETNSDFLKRLYTKDEFNLTTVSVDQLDFSVINEQNLIILNGLKRIPNGMETLLKSFVENGNSLLIIPSNEADLISYNQLFTTLNLPEFSQRIESEKRITNINFSHPLLDQVFDSKVNNFQYPKVKSFYPFTRANSPILSFEDNTAFLTNTNTVYAFSAALEEINSNFKNSPLIVPILYNIGKQSLRSSQLYYTVGQENKIDIIVSLGQDDILKLENESTSTIPFQQTFNHKVQLITEEYPSKAGLYSVKSKDSVIRKLSYNYSRSESNLNFLSLEDVPAIHKNNTVAQAVQTIKSKTKVNELWKWFVTFALAFLIVEMLILKLLK